MSQAIRVVIVDDHAVITDGLSNLLTLQPDIDSAFSGAVFTTTSSIVARRAIG